MALVFCSVNKKIILRALLFDASKKWFLVFYGAFEVACIGVFILSKILFGDTMFLCSPSSLGGNLKAKPISCVI
jgi:hypothetical protein